MNIDTYIIKKVLWEKFPDIPEWKINNIVKLMIDLQDKEDKSFEDFVDRL